MIREFYKDRTILLTGVTGFLGKGLLAKILRDLPQVHKVYVLIRPRKQPDGTVLSVAERLERDCFATSLFDRFKATDPRAYEEAKDKVVAVDGDLTAPDLGFEQRVREQLLDEIDLVIGSAATVEFDAPLDFSLKLNTLGPQEVLKFARACRREVVFLQVSTAYVNGRRSGSIPEELLPLDRTIAQMMGSPSTDKPFDPEAEIRDCQASCQNLHAQAASAAQLEIFRRQILDQRHSRQLSEKRLEKLIENRRKSWIERRLVEEGMRRAKTYGWNDIYTFTKAMGEQMLVKHHGDVPLVIVRPSVIESSLKDPEPGWISGLKVSDPLIVAYGRGLVPDFPARRNVAMDLIPVDIVVNVILGAATRACKEEVGVFQVASSAENPLINADLFEYIKSHFRAHPMSGRDGRIPSLPEWTFSSQRKFKILFYLKYMYPLRAWQWLLKRLPGRLVSPPRKRSLVALRTRLQRLLYYTDLFAPYAHLDCRFESQRTRDLYESLSPEEQRIFDMDVRQIDWAEYYPKIHLPGLRKHVLKEDAIGDPLLHEAPEEVGEEEERWHEEEGIETIPDLIGWACSRYADKVAFQVERKDRWVRYTYREMQQRVDLLAATWQEQGLEPGHRVMLWTANSPEWVMAYMAASSLGLTVVPLDPHTREEEIWALADFTEARALITSPDYLTLLAAERVAERRALDEPLHFLDLEQGGSGLGREGEGAPSSLEWRRPRVAPDMVASIIFTSGTAVDPRGVLLTHGNFIANLLALAQVQPVYQSDRILSVLPLHHGLEFTGGLLMSILGGATTTYLESFNSREILRAIHATGTTALLSVPRILKVLADRVQRLDNSADLSSLRLVVSGGAPLSSEIHDAYQGLGIRLCEGYGLTEAAPIVAVNPLERPRRGSVGQVLPGQEVAIAGADGEEGEILVKGANIMAGYLNKTEITAAALRDGWLHTGDLGYVDADGYLFITGRCKSMIVTGAGKNVYPEEVEALYGDLPYVTELGVAGVYSPRTLGEEIHGVAVLESAGVQEEEKACGEIRTRSYQISRTLSTYQRIQHLHIWKRPLPRLDDGDLDRAALLAELQLEREGAEIDESLPPWERQVYQQVSQVTGLSFSEVVAHSEAPLDTLLDSLMGVEFGACLEERLGVKLEPIDRSRCSLRDLVAGLESSFAKQVDRLVEGRDGHEASRYWSRLLGTEERRPARWGGLGRRVLQGLLWRPGRLLFNVLFSYRAHGLENLPQDRPYLIAANYTSHLDPPSILLALRSHVDCVTLAVGRSYFSRSVLSGWFLRTFANALALDHGENFRQSLIEIRSLLETRRPLLVFPEGMRSPSGQLQPFKTGVGLLALELDLPIVPVHVHGSFQARARGRRSRRPLIRLRFGQPLEMEPYRDRCGSLHRYEIYRLIVEELKRRIDALARRNGD